MPKRIVITGVTSGIGKALFHYFLDRGEFVIGIARNPERIQALESSIDHNDYAFYQSDFAKLSDIHDTIQAIREDFKDGIDVLINNAAIVPKKKVITEDGHELQYQVNHLAVVLMTHGLFPLLKKRKGRVITTGSDAHQKASFDPDDLEATNKYHALRSYARTKLYNLMFTIGFNDFYGRKAGVDAFCVHPGRVRTEIGTKQTSKLYTLMWRLFTRKGLDPSRTVYTYGFLVYEKDVQSSLSYFYQGQPHLYSPIARDRENIAVLMDATLKALGIDFNQS
ncbi:MAG: SDR family NAD(P)-dependent oxidoreductase [Bacillota bacterium]